MFWLLVRLLKTAPDDVPAGEIRAALDARLTPEGLRSEAAFIAAPDGAGAAVERPYGWGWALALAAELARLGRPGRPPLGGCRPPAGRGRGRELPRLAAAGQLSAANRGAHQQRLRPLDGRCRTPTSSRDGELGRALRGAAQRWYAADADYPGAWEPSGQDFLSPALCEAELMARLLPPADFPGLADPVPARHRGRRSRPALHGRARLAAYAVLLFS